MIAGHLTKKNGYWYMILQLRDDAGRPKQKWLATHLKVEGNKRRAEELLFAARREYTDLADMQKRNNGIFFSDYCCFANKLRKIFIQSAKKKRRLKGF